jgi:hypothetical protein
MIGDHLHSIITCSCALLLPHLLLLLIYMLQALPLLLPLLFLLLPYPLLLLPLLLLLLLILLPHRLPHRLPHLLLLMMYLLQPLPLLLLYLLLLPLMLLLLQLLLKALRKALRKRCISSLLLVKINRVQGVDPFWRQSASIILTSNVSHPLSQPGLVIGRNFDMTVGSLELGKLQKALRKRSIRSLLPVKINRVQGFDRFWRQSAALY